MSKAMDEGMAEYDEDDNPLLPLPLQPVHHQNMTPYASFAASTSIYSIILSPRRFEGKEQAEEAWRKWFVWLLLFVLVASWWRLMAAEIGSYMETVAAAELEDYGGCNFGG